MGSIRNQLVRAAAVSALGVTAMAAFIAPASASQVAATATHMTGAAPAAKPNTNIQGSPATWSPAKLTAPPATGTCSATNYSFTITNKTTKTQTIQIKSGSAKKTVGKLAAGKNGPICLTGKKGESGSFYLVGSTSVLSVTLS